MLKKILHIILLLTNAVFALSLILAYLSVYISPEICWVPAFFGLAYPALIIVNFLFHQLILLHLNYKFLTINV